MTIVERHARELDRAIRRAVRKHPSVRTAAAHLGMPKSRLFDYCQANDIAFAKAKP